MSVSTRFGDGRMIVQSERDSWIRTVGTFTYFSLRCCERICRPPGRYWHWPGEQPLYTRQLRHCDLQQRGPDFGRRGTWRGARLSPEGAEHPSDERVYAAYMWREIGGQSSSKVGFRDPVDSA